MERDSERERSGELVKLVEIKHVGSNEVKCRV